MFFKVTEGQEPNPEWEAKLERGSKKFVELKEKAVSWAGNKFGGGATESDEQAKLK